MPPNINLDGDIYNFTSWEAGAPEPTNPTRSFTLSGNKVCTVSYTLQLDTKFIVRTYVNDQEVILDADLVQNNVVLQSFRTGGDLFVNPGSYVIRVHYDGKAHDYSWSIESGQTLLVDVRYSTSPNPWDQIIEWWNDRSTGEQILIGAGVPTAVITAILLTR